MKECLSIEIKERENLDIITQVIKDKFDTILERLRLRLNTYCTWAPLIKTERKRLTDLGTGAERILNFVFCRHMGNKWKPVSIPFGSNLFFESKDAFINIDIKTMYADNTRDYKGLVEVGEAQTTYSIKWKDFERLKTKLQPFYKVDDIKKYCLTYIIQVIHIKPEDVLEKRLDPNPVALNIITVPNGLLYNIYKEEIVGYPKSYHRKGGKNYRPMNFRYTYYKAPYFKLLKGNYNYRIRVFFNKKYNSRRYREVTLTPIEITRMESIPHHILTFFSR